MYTVYFVICMFTSLNHTPNAEQCAQIARPISFPSHKLCQNRLDFIRLRYSTREAQDQLLVETTIPNMKNGRLYFISECRVPEDQGYLQCVDCAS
jgi:hypothetical protein